MDFLDNPEWVAACLKSIQAAWENISEAAYQIVRDSNDGGSAIGWMGSWAPGRHAQMQCDLSVMTSTAIFDEFFMPELTAQCAWADYPVYHLDGVEQVRHLDSLLSLDKLSAIQWTSVAGQTAASQNIASLKRIQDAGKSILFNGIAPKEIPILLEHLKPEGCYFFMNAGSPEEADAIVRMCNAAPSV